MPRKITFALQKGGVGKTSSTAVTAKILAAAGYDVLAVDMDSQGNLTKMLTGDSIYRFSGNTIMEAIQTGDAEPYIHRVSLHMDLIPAEDRLAAFSRHIYTSKVENPYGVLQRLLEPVEHKYDFIFVDTGPTLGDTFINSIAYVDHVIIPVDLGELAMDAMVRIIEFIEDSKKEGLTSAEVSGILLTMRDGRVRNEREISEGIRATYGDLVFGTEIRRRARIKEIASKGIDLKDASMDDYLSFVEEMIERTSGKEDKQ